MQGWQWENVATLAICGATIVGLYALGAGGHSFWPLLMLLNISYPDAAKAERRMRLEAELKRDA
jgi:hypothetical protein